jgi:TRAP transporter TAXI family solute receptor
MITRRTLFAAAAAPALARPALAQTATQNALTARANAGTVGIIAGGIDGTYARIAADLAAVLDDGDNLRVLPILGKGSLQNISDIMLLRGIDIGIVQSDVLAYAQRQRLLPSVATLVQYIAKLYDEEVYILAGPDADRLEDLAGKPVDIDLIGSGTSMTASLLFEALGIPIQPRHDTQDLALERLKRGEIAALAYVAGKPARLFTGLPSMAGLKLLPVQPTPALFETYLPAVFQRADYPNLIERDSIDTIAVGAVMAVYAWPPGTERHRKVARFVEAFFARFPTFLQPPRHPKWREVNLAAQVPGWTRFGPAATLASH